MTTATDLIHSSMRLLGAIAAGETLETNELADALITLNQMLASWSDERLTVYQIRADTFAMAGQTYSLGPAGVAPRPTQVIAARAQTATYGRSLTLIDVNRWTDILERGTVTLPMKAYVDYAFPLATVWLWPQPLTGTVVEVYTMQEYTVFPENAPSPQPLHNFQPMRLNYTIAAQSKFTIGAGGDLAFPRPARCDAIAASNNGFRRMVEIVSAAEWSGLLEPNGQQIQVPIEMYVDYGYPSVTLHVWPPPAAVGTLEVQSLQPLPVIAALTDNIDLPPGYETAIRFNLAVALLPEYPRMQVDPTLIPQAQALKQTLVQMNTANQRLGVLPPNEVQSSPVNQTVQTG